MRTDRKIETNQRKLALPGTCRRILREGVVLRSIVCLVVGVMAITLMPAAGEAQASTAPPCQAPRHALVLVLSPTGAINHQISILDRDTGKVTCALGLPKGSPPHAAVAIDGRIFVAVWPEKLTEQTTDAGYVDVIAPNGRLLHRLLPIVGGVTYIALDHHDHLFVSTGNEKYVNGNAMPLEGDLEMYDAHSLALVRTFKLDPQTFGGEFALAPDERTIAAVEGGTSAHVAVFDVASGSLMGRFPVPNPFRIEFKGPDILVVGNGNQPSRLLSPRSGASRVVQVPEWQPPELQLDGIAYKRRSADLGLFQPRTVIERRDIHTGKSLAPFSIAGSAEDMFVVDPDPQLDKNVRE